MHEVCPEMSVARLLGELKRSEYSRFEPHIVIIPTDDVLSCVFNDELKRLAYVEIIDPDLVDLLCDYPRERPKANFVAVVKYIKEMPYGVFRAVRGEEPEYGTVAVACLLEIGEGFLFDVVELSSTLPYPQEVLGRSVFNRRGLARRYFESMGFQNYEIREEDKEGISFVVPLTEIYSGTFAHDLLSYLILL